MGRTLDTTPATMSVAALARTRRPAARRSIRGVRGTLGGLPSLLKIGVGVLAVGLAADIAFHLMSVVGADAPADHDHASSSTASLIHLVVFAGLGLAFAGAVSAAIDRARSLDRTCPRPERDTERLR